jgi:hypothetical protein
VAIATRAIATEEGRHAVKDLLGNGTMDAQDMARWEGLALLLGSLRTADDRARFARLYRAAAQDDDAGEAVDGLLAAAAALWGRGQRPSPSRRVAQAA